jgi:hypothetical protein
MELFEEANLAYEKIEALLVKIYLKKNELDKLSVLTQFKGKRILDGSLSASRDAEQHLYLMTGVKGSSENRINLNTGLNIPKISYKTLGLGTIFFNTPEEGLKTMMMVENALGIVNRLKNRFHALKDHLHQIEAKIDISIANHQAADSTPPSLAKAKEIFRSIHTYNPKH